MKIVAVFLILSVVVYNARALPTSEESDEETKNKPAISASPRFSRPLLCNFRCHMRCFFRGYWTGYCKDNSCTCAGSRNPDGGNGNNNSTTPDFNNPSTNDPINGGDNEETSTPSNLPGFPSQPPLGI